MADIVNRGNGFLERSQNQTNRTFARSKNEF